MQAFVAIVVAATGIAFAASPAQAAAPTCDSRAAFQGTIVFDWDIVVKAWYHMPAKYYQQYGDYDWYCSLRYGNTGNGVKALQISLNKCNHVIGTTLVVDGIYGSKTRSAVYAVQRWYRIQQDGIYGPQTARHMQHEASTERFGTVCGQYRS